MNLRRTSTTDPVLITEAEPSLAEQHDRRKRNYIVTMVVRAVCLVIATIFYATPLVMGVFAGLAIVLPWMAVLVANDRPPKKATKHRRFRGDDDSPTLAATPRPMLDGPGRVIDSDA